MISKGSIQTKRDFHYNPCRVSVTIAATNEKTTHTRYAICINKYMMWTMNDLRTKVHTTSRLLSKYIKEHVDIRLASHRGRSGSVLMKVSSFYRHTALSRRVQCGIIDRE